MTGDPLLFVRRKRTDSLAVTMFEAMAAMLAVQSTRTRVFGRGWLRKWGLPLGSVGILAFRWYTQEGPDLLTEFFIFGQSLLLRIGVDGRGQRLVKDFFGLFLCSSVVRSVLHLGGGFSSNLNLKDIQGFFYELALDLPIVGDVVRKEIAKEAAKLEKSIEDDLKVQSRAIPLVHKTLPSRGIAPSEILQLMKVETAKENVVWQTGRVSGSVYHGEQAHQELLNTAFGLYSIANPLHPDIWPSCMKFEAEVISMTTSLVNDDGRVATVCGSTTSGGTESIILAIKAHRDYYCKMYSIQEPELVCCTSAHAAVDKACDLMNIKLIKVPMDERKNYKADVAAMRAAVGPNTIMLYASAPSYPQGVIDDIEELSALASKQQIGLHVDCCLGGFVLPFMRKLGYPVPPFDFALPGVTSMSLDTHKYGYALKGASVVLYRTKELRHAQYFCYSDWTGGMYTTPTIAGSRSGGLIAQCWASMVAMGEEGYLRHTKDIVETTKLISDGLREIKGLKQLGNAEAMIVCFSSTKEEEGLNIYSVADKMSKKGWSLNALQHPACVHLCITVRHVGKHAVFLSDLADSVQAVRQAIAAGDKVEGKAAIYGMTSSMPSGPVNTLLRAYNDVVLRV